VATAAKSTTEGAEYTNKAAGELARLASTLQTLVRQFDFGKDDQAASTHRSERTVVKPASKKSTGVATFGNGHARKDLSVSVQ
jgi:hypothetical protein